MTTPLLPPLRVERAKNPLSALRRGKRRTEEEYANALEQFFQGDPNSVDRFFDRHGSLTPSTMSGSSGSTSIGDDAEHEADRAALALSPPMQASTPPGLPLLCPPRRPLPARSQSPLPPRKPSPRHRPPSRASLSSLTMTKQSLALRNAPQMPLTPRRHRLDGEPGGAAADDGGYEFGSGPTGGGWKEMLDYYDEFAPNPFTVPLTSVDSAEGVDKDASSGGTSCGGLTEATSTSTGENKSMIAEKGLKGRLGSFIFGPKGSKSGEVARPPVEKKKRKLPPPLSVELLQKKGSMCN